MGCRPYQSIHTHIMYSMFQSNGSTCVLLPSTIGSRQPAIPANRKAEAMCRWSRRSPQSNHQHNNSSLGSIKKSQFTYTFTHIYIYIYLYLFIFYWFIFFIHKYIHLHLYIYIHTCIYVHMYTYLYIYIYIYFIDTWRSNISVYADDSYACILGINFAWF